MAESNKLCTVQVEKDALAVALAGLPNHSLRRRSSPTAAQLTLQLHLGQGNPETRSAVFSMADGPLSAPGF